MVAAEVTNTSCDFGPLEPIVSAAQSQLERVGITDTPHVVVADAGYWHQRQMEALVERGIQVLISPDAGKSKGARPGWDGGHYAFMRHLLQTEARRRALPKTQGDDRAGLGRHQVQPADRPLLTRRKIGGPLGMAIDHRNTQPPESSTGT